MITGAQIRASLELLGWNALDLSERTRIFAATIIRAEGAEGAAALTMLQENSIRRALMAAGIEFVTGNDGRPSVQLLNARVEAHTQLRRRADVIVEYLRVLRLKLGTLNSGDTETVEGLDAISLLFPPGVSGEDLDRRAEAIISAFAAGSDCDYDYQPNQAKLRFIKK